MVSKAVAVLFVLFDCSGLKRECGDVERVAEWPPPAAHTQNASVHCEREREKAEGRGEEGREERRGERNRQVGIHV